MNEMTERVARAICKAKGLNPDMCVFGSGGISFSDGKTTYASECHRYAWQDELVVARAAIEAMREPTEAMIKAGEETIFEHRAGPADWSLDATREGWQASIDAALT